MTMTAAIDMNPARGMLPSSVRESLRDAGALLSRAGIDGARLDAEVLLAEALGCDRRTLYLHDDRPIAAPALERLRSWLTRRASGEPVAYITGRREFWSRDFMVAPAVLVPRPETELLVETVIGLFEAESRISNLKLRILELGTGSGAIAVTLAKELGGAEIWATDISLDALDVARTNARRHGVEGQIHFLAGSLFEPVRDRQIIFDAIVANPPYVRRYELDTLPRDVRDFEPRAALDGGPDGLDFYRRIFPEAGRHLDAAGFVAVEIGADMGEEVARLFADAGGYTPPRVSQDYAGKDRVVCARRIV
jgi:release factor glutamine methyltransferase